MVLASGEDGRNPFGEVNDRSVSYLDLREQILYGGDNVFESVRKFGRPRQQISEVLEFLDSSGKGDCHYRYHFGQCLVLPKVSIRSSEGNAKRSGKFDVSYRTVHPKPVSETAFRACCPERIYSNPPPGTIPENANGFAEYEMHRWTENFSENQQKRWTRKNSAEESGGTSRSDAEREDVKRSRREIGTGDRHYDQNSVESRSRRRRDSDELTNAEIGQRGDVRENSKSRVTNEKESSKTFGERRRRQYPEDGDGWMELHRSKSTPDVVGTVGKRKPEVWPEDERKRSGTMATAGAKSWTVYNDQQEADSLNEPQPQQERVSSTEIPGPEKSRRTPSSGKNFFGQFLISRGTTPCSDMFSSTEPFSQFWVTLSNIYGQTLVVLMMAFALTEVMDNSVNLLSLQGIFLMYLYVGSIAVIICIYIWVLIDSCSSMQNDAADLVPRTIAAAGVLHDRETDLQNLSSTKFGSLKKAHISRDRTSNTSFYLRIGAIAFGLGTLVFNGLEMAMHSMMEGSCLNDVVFVHPILHGLFTFLQMHFLFVNSQVLVERFGLAARFGFMHLAATNLALWIRLVIWESGNEWIQYVHFSLTDEGRSSEVPTSLHLRGFPKFITRKERESDSNPVISAQHVTQVVSLHQCVNANTLGQLWTSSMPFLYPFIIQFSIIAAAVTFTMGQNVAKDHLFFQKQKKIGGSDSKSCTLATLPEAMNTWSVDCGGASKGLFLGILCLVTGVVVIIIFLVVKENEDFPQETIFWLTTGTILAVLSIAVVMNVIGLIQIRKLSVMGTKMLPLDKILAVVSVLGVQLYSIMGIVVGAAGVAEERDDEFVSPIQKKNAMLLAVSLMQFVQAVTQSCFIVEGIRRTSLSRIQVLTKPARQIVTFLMFANVVLWALDTFVLQSWTSQELQLRFFGLLTWGVISRIGLPLMIFYRFHSCVFFLEIWKKSYNSIHMDPGN